MEIAPIHNSPALGIELDKYRAIVVGDLHLGLAAELSDKGIEIPARFPEAKKRILDLIDEHEADKLFFLGDIKHNIPITSREEWEQLPDFFSELSEEAKIEIIPGNHDGDIKGLIPKNVKLHGAKGTTIGNGQIGLIHGHAWPKKEVLKSDTIIMGHNHPTIELEDDLGGKAKEPSWIRTKLIPENLPEELEEAIDEEPPQVMIIPAFSKLVGGGAINQELPEDLLGPLFEAEAIDLDNAEAHLLDGTFLGNLKNIRG